MLIKDRNLETTSDGSLDHVEMLVHIPVTDRKSEYQKYVASSKAKSPIRTEMEIGHISRLSVEKATMYLDGRREYEFYSPEANNVKEKIINNAPWMLIGVCILGIVVLGFVKLSFQ